MWSLNLLPQKGRRLLSKLENLEESSAGRRPPHSQRKGALKSPGAQARPESACRREYFVPSACFNRQKQVLFAFSVSIGRLGGISITCIKCMGSMH